MRSVVIPSLIWLFLVPVIRAEVRVSVQDSNGLATVSYQCTAGEVMRGFALDVTVDQGQILSVTNYFRGPCTVAAQGYGIFPASFRDAITVSSGTNANWSASGYSPLAVVADNPSGTLPGLNSSGVTLEFAALWDPSIPAAMPPSSGVLCQLQLSQAANVSVTANSARGGLIAAPSDVAISSRFAGTLVGPAILKTTVTNGLLTVLFQDGELLTAPTVNGPWTGTGNTNGTYSEMTGQVSSKFYRVQKH